MWKRVAMALAVGLAVGLVAACGPVGTESPAPEQTELGTLDFVTLNIWHNQQDWPSRLELIVSGLRAADPDAICLQEVLQNDSLPNQAETLGRRLGYGVHFESWDTAGSVKRYGNAILTKMPMLERDHRRLDPANDYRVILHARVAAAGDTLDLYCTHLHHTQTEQGAATRRTQILDALEFIDETRGNGPVIFGGDFNASVGSPELAALRDRFADAFGLLHGDTADAVTTLVTAKGHRAERIDHVFFRSGVDAEIVPRSAERILDEPSAAGVWPSDHFGILVRFAVLGEDPDAARIPVPR